MNKKTVILSYDYELFFGDRSGTVLKSLIEPTSVILDAMDEVGLKGNFFVDWQMLKYLQQERNEKAQQDYIMIKNQLKDIVRRGHRIELHIHPHWVDAKYNGDGTWNFDNFSHYSLQSFSQEDVTQMFIDGTNLLNSIAREVDPLYKIIAFRAGGWAVQPFDKLKAGFEQAGIVIDSSPSKGFYVRNLHSYYDFRVMPDDSLYHFDNDVCKSVDNGGFICVPITSYKRTFINKVIDKLTRIFSNNFECLCDGTHSRKEDREAETKGEGSEVFTSGRNMLSFYTSPFNIPLIVLGQKKDILCFIEHPKDMIKMTSRSIKALRFVAKTIFYKDLLDYE